MGSLLMLLGKFSLSEVLELIFKEFVTETLRQKGNGYLLDTGFASGFVHIVHITLHTHSSPVRRVALCISEEVEIWRVHITCTWSYH